MYAYYREAYNILLYNIFGFVDLIAKQQNAIFFASVRQIDRHRYVTRDSHRDVRQEIRIIYHDCFQPSTSSVQIIRKRLTRIDLQE